jgi:hypothetical protein
MQIALESDGDDDNAWGFPDDDRVVESDSDTSVIAAMEKELFTPTQGEKSAGPVDMTDPLLLHLQALENHCRVMIPEMLGVATPMTVLRRVMPCQTRHQIRKGNDGKDSN